jgi:hypothetical protein
VRLSFHFFYSRIVNRKKTANSELDMRTLRRAVSWLMGGAHRTVFGSLNIFDLNFRNRGEGRDCIALRTGRRAAYRQVCSATAPKESK